MAEITEQSMTELDVEFCRSKFPQFRNPETAAWAFCENAGGSYAPDAVVERMERYFRELKSQPYYPHDMAAELGRGMDDSTAKLSAAINAEPDEIVLGASSTINVYVAANALRSEIEPGDQIVLSAQDHETNIGAWARLADAGAEIRWWHPDRESGLLDIADLESLLSDRTRLVCVTHCSNVAGTINPVADFARLAHGAGARICVDGVSYAPHGSVDVRLLDVDYYLMSLYKTYSAFQGLMYVRRELIESADHQGHFFNESQIRKRLDASGPSHGEIYAAGGMIDYLSDVHVHHGGSANDPVAAQVASAFALFAGQEQKLLTPLVGYLLGNERVRLIGAKTADRNVRVPTIAFTVDGAVPEDVVNRLVEYRIGAGFGHFYAYRLIERLGIDPDEGVVRISLVHYNTEAEVDRIIAALDDIL